MQQIHKNTPIGNAIIDGILNSAWSNDENRYEGNLYYGLINEQHRISLINLFLAEQNNKCCYCMKYITIDDVTIEHIIPQKATEAEFHTYLIVPELTDTLIHKNNFDRITHTIPPALYPHDLAYNNLIASCDSKTHCNHKRGRAFVVPFVYNSQVENIFSYQPFGSCFCEDIEFDVLNLNNDFLQMVRTLWYLLSQKLQTMEGIGTAYDLQLIVNEIISNEEDKFIETFTGDASRVSELLKYRWFFYYYKNINN